LVEGLHPGTVYNFTVVAVNEEGPSEPSIITQLATLDEGMYIINLSTYKCIRL